MRVAILILTCLLLSGCRTFTNTQVIIVKDLMTNAYSYGYHEGMKNGEELGESIGYIHGIKECTDTIMKERP